MRVLKTRVARDMSAQASSRQWEAAGAWEFILGAIKLWAVPGPERLNCSLSRENVGRPTQSTSTNPTDDCETDFGKVRPGSRFSVSGRLPGETRLCQDARRQHDHRSASETRRRSGPGTGDKRNEMKCGA